MSPYPKRFSTLERDWLLERLQQSDVQTMRRVGGDSYLKSIADLIRPEFEEKWTGPYGGETDLQYQERRGNAHKDRKRDFPRWLPETQEAWQNRRNKLSYNIHRFVIEQFCTKSKRKNAPLPSIPVPDVQPPRKPRRVIGLDIYQSDISKQNASTESSLGGGKYTIGSVRAQAAKDWGTLPAEQCEPYETRARTRNQERAAQNSTPLGDNEDIDSPSNSPFPAQSIASWLKVVLEKLGMMNWGGFICAGGPDANGEIRTYIDFVGYNRHGEHLLEAVTKAACFSDDELEGLVTLWVEQAKTAAPSSSRERLQVLRALQGQDQTVELPSPDVLAALLSETFESHGVAIRPIDHPESHTEPAPPSSSLAPESESAVQSPSGARTENTDNLSTQPHMPVSAGGELRIPDPLVDGPFGYPGPVTVNTAGIDFHWGGDSALMNVDFANDSSPDSLPVPISNMRTDLDEESISQVDNVASVLTPDEAIVARLLNADGADDQGESRARKRVRQGGPSSTAKKARSRNARPRSPSGVLMPDAHGAQPRTRPARDRQMTEKGQSYAAERRKARRK